MTVLQSQGNPQTGGDAPELAGKIRSAYGWSIGANLFKHVIGVGISFLLAHFLLPTDYGLIGMVLVFMGLVSTLQDLGFGQAIVYFKEDESSYPTYFTATFCFGILLTLTGIAAAPLVAAFYHEPRLIPILRIMSVNFTITSLQTVSWGLLSKQFRFRDLAIGETAGTAIAGCIGVAMAILGYGVWSLVTNVLLSFTIQCAILLYFVRPRLTLHPKFDVLSRLVRYGTPLTGAALLHQFCDNADYLVVGRLMGPEPVGLYTLAFRLATLAHEKIAVLINRVAFPSFAAMQDDHEGLVHHWFLVSRTLSLVTFPFLAVLFMNAEDILRIFGPQWVPAAVPLRYLCVAAGLRSLIHIVLHIFSALGHTSLRLQFGVANFVLMPAGFAVGCWLAGLKGVGMAWCILYPVIGLGTLLKAKSIVKYSLWEYCLNLKFPLLVLAATSLAMLPESWMAPGIPRLGLRIASAGCAILACLATNEEVRGIVRGIRNRMRPARSAAI
jgi:teichuronic acid exporter